MAMMESASIFATIASAIGTLLALAIEIGLLVVALAIVKPRRPDAAMPFVIGAAMNGVATLLWPVFTTLVIPLLRSDGGASSMFMAQSAISLFLGLIRTAGWAIILFGIARLANPPGGAPRDPTRYG
jgi:hypothetical protein